MNSNENPLIEPIDNYTVRESKLKCIQCDFNLICTLIIIGACIIIIGIHFGVN